MYFLQEEEVETTKQKGNNWKKMDIKTKGGRQDCSVKGHSNYLID
jgi:hypothetical protein